MSYRELDSFKKKVAGINATIAKLEEKKAKQQEKKNKAEAERDALLVAEAVLGKEADDKALEKFRKEIAACDEEIIEIDGRINLIEAKRAESLAPDMPKVIEGHKREIDRLKREADAQFYDARKILCEYLLALQKVGKTREEANALHGDFLTNAKMVDPEEYSRVSWERHPLPEYPLFNNYTGLYLGIKESDQTNALNGFVAPHVLYYSLNGELVDNTTATDKLREMKK